MIWSAPSTQMGLLYRDMLSPLPDSLLLTIVSLLPFKEAVKTSILSKRWRFIWVGLVSRTMDFDERLFVKETEPLDKIMKKKQRRAFLDFLRRWVEVEYAHESHTDYFRLAFSCPENHVFELEQFIRFALSSKVKSLDLDFSDPSWDEDSDDKFQTFLSLPFYEGPEMLESLKLFSCNLLVVSGFSTFLALKKLSLGWVRLGSSDITNLLSKCPVLEVLSLKKCWDVDYFQVKTSSLKILVLDKCFPPRPDMVVVNAPKLQSFKYSGVLTSFQFGDLVSLEEALFDFGLEWEHDEYVCSDMLCSLLREISCVRTLTVCSYMLQVIPCGEEPISLKPALRCIRHLILKTGLSLSEFYGITFLLNSCPHLEALTIDLVPARLFPGYEPPFEIRHHPFYLDTPLMQYECVKKRLRSIVVNGFKGEANDLVVLKYFLKYGRVLETLAIRVSKATGPDGPSSKAVYMRRAQRLFCFPRASQRLRLHLVSLP